MGCCFGKDEDKNYGSASPDETSRLINPVSDPQARSINGDTFVTPDVDSQPKGPDDQSALSSIVHKIARDVIDVAAIEGGGMEQHEFHDKARQYSNRVNMVLSSFSRHKMQKSHLPKGVPSPFNVLNAQPVAVGDIELICNLSEKALKAVKEVNVDHKEDLVVPFGVP